MATGVIGIGDRDNGCAGDVGRDVAGAGDGNEVMGVARESVWVETEMLWWVSVISNIERVVWAPTGSIWMKLLVGIVIGGFVWVDIDVVIVFCASVCVPISSRMATGKL